MTLSFRKTEKSQPHTPEGEAVADRTEKPRFRRARRETRRGEGTSSKHRLWPAALVLTGGFAALAYAAFISTIFIGPNPAALPLIGAALSLAGAILLLRGIRQQRKAHGARQQALSARLESLEDQAWEIRESEEIHRTLTEGFGDVVVYRDEDGAINFANSIYPLYFDQHHPAPAPGETGTIAIKTRQGERWFSWTEAPVRDSDTGRTGLQCVGRDVTERQKSEEERQQALELAEKAGSARARFLATMSHEIRTPLNGVLGMNRLLMETTLSPTQQNYCRAIGQSGQLLLGLIEDVLDTALVDEGKVALAPTSTDLRGLVEGVGELLAARQRETIRDDTPQSAALESLPIGIFIDKACPAQIMVDEKRLRQILMNLVGNALKFTETGGVGLFVEPADGADNAPLKFTIRDSGPGITDEDRARLFEPFQQAKVGTTRQHGGAGLGLSIARHLVGLMGGELALDSAGQGCSFTFTLDLPRMVDDVARELPRAARPIALVMPRSPARDALAKTVVQEGHTCHCFTSLDLLQAAQKAGQWPSEQWNSQDDTGKKGQIKKPQTNKTGAVVILSQTHGKEALQLRSFMDDPRTGPVKFLSLSAAARHAAHGLDLPLPHADRETVDRHAVFDGWLTWPVRRSTLRRTLRKSISASAASRPKVSAPAMTTPDPNDTGRTVLLAEDNAINALLARSLLTKLGYQVTAVTNGEEALAQCQHTNFDLILLDLHMPVMDGMDALRHLRAGKDGNAHTPIIILSADDQAMSCDAALAAGATDFLLKPLDFDCVRTRLTAREKTPKAGKRQSV